MVHSEEWKRNWKRPDLTPLPGKNLVITEWGWAVQHPGELITGKFFDIGYGTYINARFTVIIEDDVEIGGGCHIYSHNSIDNVTGPIVFRKGCKIGAHSVILPNVIMGENAVVGAFSLVKEDIPANSTAYGIPAKVVKSY